MKKKGLTQLKDDRKPRVRVILRPERFESFPEDEMIKK
jgi:hypothetical protein